MDKLLTEILKYKNKIIIIMSLLFSALYYYGDVVVFNEKAFSIKYVLVFVFYFVLFKIYAFFTRKQYDEEYNFPLFDQKNLFIYFLIVFIPHVLIKYPIALDVDAYLQLNQTLGTDQLTTHWPLFHTLLLTYFYKYGQLLGNHNIGMFILSVIQTIFYAYIFSYVINSFYKMRFPKIFIILSIIFYSFNPMVMASNGTTLKDANYCALLVLLCVLLIEYIYYGDNFWNNKKSLILLFLVSFLLPMFRKNGTYVVVPVLITLLFIEIFKRKKMSVKLIAFVLVCIITPSIFSNTLQTIYNAKDGSRREIFSLPFQQTARLIKYHEDLITEEEKIIINKVLDYDKVADTYMEHIADPVKYLFNNDAGAKDILDYLLVWFKQFFKAPLTYIEATSIQNIYIVYPRINLFHYNVECNGGFVGYEQDKGYLQTPLWLKNNQHYYFSVLEVMHTLPVINILTNPALYVILFIFAFVLEMERKGLKKKLVFIPLLLSLLMIIAGPVIIDFPRYMYPLVWTMPIYTGVLIKDFS